MSSQEIPRDPRVVDRMSDQQVRSVLIKILPKYYETSDLLKQITEACEIQIREEQEMKNENHRLRAENARKDEQLRKLREENNQLVEQLHETRQLVTELTDVRESQYHNQLQGPQIQQEMARLKADIRRLTAENEQQLVQLGLLQEEYSKSLKNESEIRKEHNRLFEERGELKKKLKHIEESYEYSCEKLHEFHDKHADVLRKLEESEASNSELKQTLSHLDTLLESTQRRCNQLLDQDYDELKTVAEGLEKEVQQLRSEVGQLRDLQPQFSTRRSLGPTIDYSVFECFRVKCRGDSRFA